jgi:hypothetical protein
VSLRAEALEDVQVRGAIAEVGKEIDGTQVRKLHDLGFPSWAEVSFAEVVEIPNEFLYGFRRGRSGRNRPSPCG